MNVFVNKFQNRAFAVGLLLGAMSVSAQAPGDLRVALVIGNAAYTGVPALANPVNDAAAMATTLKGLGFSVLEVKDGTREQMAQAIAQMRQTLAGRKGVGMLYYAGHGLQLDWRNYMVPVDAKLGSAAEVPRQTVDVNSVIDAFKTAGNRMNIVVLDACRDNPFADKGSGKGLAQLDAPPGTFLAYATAPGNVAEDGDAKSANGLYTSFLLQELKKPQARIEDVFKRVRFGVRQASSGRQIPWESTSLEDDFFFDINARAPRKLSASEEEALLRLEMAAWDRIKDSERKEDFFAFVQQFPNGSFAEKAQLRLNRVEKPAVVAAPAQTGATTAVVAGDLFRPGDRYVMAQLDGVNGVRQARYPISVTGVQGDRLLTAESNVGYVRDATGGLLQDNFARYEPSISDLPAEYAAGRSWSGTSLVYRGGGNSARMLLSYRSRIVGRERVVVPAGSFDAWRIETTASLAGNFSAAFTMRTWAVPQFGMPLRQEIKINTPNVATRRWDAFELESAQVAR